MAIPTLYGVGESVKSQSAFSKLLDAIKQSNVPEPEPIDPALNFKDVQNPLAIMAVLQAISGQQGGVESLLDTAQARKSSRTATEMQRRQGIFKTKKEQSGMNVEMAKLGYDRAEDLRREGIGTRRYNKGIELQELAIRRQEIKDDETEQKYLKTRYDVSNDPGEAETNFRLLQGTKYAPTKSEHDQKLRSMSDPLIKDLNQRIAAYRRDTYNPNDHDLAQFQSERQEIIRRFPNAKPPEIPTAKTIRAERIDNQKQQFKERREDGERRFQAIFKQRGEHFYKGLAARWASIQVAKDALLVNQARGTMQGYEFMAENFGGETSRLVADLQKDLISTQSNRAKLVTAAARIIGVDPKKLTPEVAKIAFGNVVVSKTAPIGQLEPLRKLIAVDDQIQGLESTIQGLQEDRGAVGLPAIDLDQLAAGGVFAPKPGSTKPVIVGGIGQGPTRQNPRGNPPSTTKKGKTSGKFHYELKNGQMVKVPG